MAKTDTRVTSNLVNVIPWTYSDDTIADQTERPRFGDMWITEEQVAGDGYRQNEESEEPARPLPIRNYNQVSQKQPLKIT